MSWRIGDIAYIDCPYGDKMGIDGELCTLREYAGDKRTESGGIIPSAWWVQIHSRGYIDKVLVSECILNPMRDHREKVEWADCVWQPIEHLRYP